MSYPDVRNLFSPYQTHINDTPVLLFNINDSAAQLTETRATRLRRAQRISPVLLREEIPVAPLPNPHTGISHHRIQITNPETPALVLELFFRDTDFYFLGFRRGVVNFMADGTPQEPEWGLSFVFDDLSAPSFLGAVKMGIDSNHTGKGDFPGQQAMLHTFYTLTSFEDRVHIGVDEDGARAVRGLHHNLRSELEIAVGRIIIVFCEAVRLRSVYTEVLAALGGDDFSRPVSSWFWNLVHAWGTLSQKVLEMRSRRTLALDSKLPAVGIYSSHGFKVLGDLIGEDGELLLLKMAVEDRRKSSRRQGWTDTKYRFGASISLIPLLWNRNRKKLEEGGAEDEEGGAEGEAEREEEDDRERAVDVSAFVLPGPWAVRLHFRCMNSLVYSSVTNQN